MPISLPELPYAMDALEPHMSRGTLEFHHGKHHKSYVDKTNKLIDGTKLENAMLEEIMRATADDENQVDLFNNAAQVWNHNFFWNCMTPGGGKLTDGKLTGLLQDEFGSLNGFNTAFQEAATGRFGSGWAWLVYKNGNLQIMSTANADNPMQLGLTPLLTCDVWEHAYYLDYQNARAKFVETFLEHLVNWPFVEKRLEAAEEERHRSAA